MGLKSRVPGRHHIWKGCFNLWDAYNNSPSIWILRKRGKHTYQEPDSKLAQKPLIMLVIIFVIIICVVQRMMRGRQAQLPPAIELVLSLFSMEFSLFQQAKRWRTPKMNSKTCTWGRHTNLSMSGSVASWTETIGKSDSIWVIPIGKGCNDGAEDGGQKETFGYIN